MANEIFTLIAKQDSPEARAEAISKLAGLRSVSVEVLTAEFEAYQADNKAKLEKAARKARLEALSNEAKGMTLNSDNLGDFVTRVVAEKVSVILNPDLTLTVSLPKARGGGKGGGKPKADQPRPYSTKGGERMLGAVTDYLDANFSEEEQREAGLYRPNGVRRAGQDLAKRAIAAGFMGHMPLDD